MTWKELISRATPLLIIILLISFFAGDGWSAIPSGLVAWGTILLAYATFSLIKQSKEQETRRIIFEQEVAETNNNLRILDEVIQWATDIMTWSSDRNNKYATDIILLDIRLSLESQFIKGPYIAGMVASFNKDLVESVENLRKYLAKQIDLIEKLQNTPIKTSGTERQEILGEVKVNKTEIVKAFLKVIDEAVKTKLSILRL